MREMTQRTNFESAPLSKKVLVAGGTGVLGRRAVRELVRAGHRPTVLSRSAESDDLLRDTGAMPVRVDLFDWRSVRQAVAGHDTVFNLATNIPPPDKGFQRKAWVSNDRVRIEGSKMLAEAARSEHVSRFIQESITFPYRDNGSEWIDETSPLAPTWNTRSALQAEANARNLAEQGIITVILRFAALYAWDASYTRFSIDYASGGKAPLLGDPRRYYTMIHADDAAKAIVAALDIPAGTYNVAESEPLTRAELLQIMARAVGRSGLRRAPDWLVKLIGGEAAGVVMRSQRVSNEALRGVSDWVPEFASARTGWSTVVDESRAGAC
jgi:nucleoside-diphosphate-sugar epimerase